MGERRGDIAGRRKEQTDEAWRSPRHPPRRHTCSLNCRSRMGATMGTQWQEPSEEGPGTGMGTGMAAWRRVWSLQGQQRGSR